MPAAVGNALDLPPPPLSTHTHKETVIIFDWDDTLLCSSFLASRGYNRLDEAQVRSAEVDGELALLERAVVALLSLALRFGAVHIITNAESGWVQLSAQTFLPAVLSVLDHVQVSSARSTYEPLFPQAPVQWKYCAFHDKVVGSLGDCESDRMRNVVSFGDSRVEREAVLSVARGLPRVRCKSIKFAERPTIEQLRLQLELVTRCFAQIAAHDGDLDLQLSVLPAPLSPTAPATAPAAPPTAGPLLDGQPAAAASAPPPLTARSGVAPMDTEPPAPVTTAASPAAPAPCTPPAPAPAPSPAAPSTPTAATASPLLAAADLARVQLSGYQTGAAPSAVACGANSTLIVAASGAAVVVANTTPPATSPPAPSTPAAAVAAPAVSPLPLLGCSALAARACAVHVLNEDAPHDMGAETVAA